MASFGVSMPDVLAEELDSIAEKWFSNRSNAITRIFLEWQQFQVEQLPLTAPAETKAPTPAAQMQANSAPELLKEAA